jgi:hypothetical protein
MATVVLTSKFHPDLLARFGRQLDIYVPRATIGNLVTYSRSQSCQS